MVLGSGNSHLFLYLFIHTFQKYSEPCEAFGTGSQNKETKMDQTQITELTVLGQKQKADTQMDDENKQPQMETRAESIFQMGEQHV